VRRLSFVLAMVGSLAAAPLFGAETSVAVASNFTLPAEEIAAAFEAATGHSVVLSFGATGGLYTQITQGAPFTVFLAADNKRPAQAVSEGFGTDGTAFTYAVGRVVLYSPGIDVADGAAVLRDGAFQHIAIADPATAPYGAAAMQVLDAFGLTDAVSSKIVTGENSNQAQQFVESGNAELGFVALSQVIGKPATQVWIPPVELYAPILQDAVLLKSGENDPVANAFIEFLKGDKARAIIEKYGYGVAR
jgi:molybdate transport system substrate-binding protein